MYAMTFDDFKRKIARIPNFPYRLEVVETCIKGTPLWNFWIESFQLETNKDLQLTIEPDGSTYTFYKLVDKNKPMPAIPTETRTKSDNEHGH